MSDVWFQHLSTTLSKNGLVAYIWDANEDRFQWKGDMRELFGTETLDLPLSSRQFHQMINPQQVPHRLTWIHEILDGPVMMEHSESFYKLRRANGSQVDIEETATLYEDEATGHKTLCGFLKLSDRDQLKAESALETEAVSDAGMTHYGRLSLQHKIEELREGDSSKMERGAYLLVVGIDRLSMLNDAFGARYADEVIEKTGARLRQIAGEAAYVTRVDGDVFGVFFPKALQNEMVAVATHMLNHFYNTPLQMSTGAAGVSVSIGGISVDHKRVRDAASLLTKAEMALRSAKDKGRGCFVSYDEEADNSSTNRLLLKSGDDFLCALKENRVKLAFQPVVNSKTQDVSFHECLIRMLDRDGQLHSAAQFYPAVEKLGLGRLVDQFALRKAVQELNLFPDLRLSVNVSHLTLANKNWLRELVVSLRDRPSVARRLIVEITESTVMDDLARTTRIVRTLQDLGCRVALDDFGSGYTSFSQLKDLDLDLVKIDQDFVRNREQGQNRLFIKTLQSLADGMNIETVGEGAETMADAKMLEEDGVHHIQGYVFGFPQVERVWLPKDHVFRRFSEEKKTEGADTEEDMVAAQ